MIMRRERCLLLALAAAACGGGSSGPSSNCPAEPAELATGTDLVAQGISEDGTVAYIAIEGTARTLRVVPMCGTESIDVATNVSNARWNGTTLVIFRNATEDLAGEMLIWRPGDASATSVASAVDPRSVRFSLDGRWIALHAERGAAMVDIALVDTSDASSRVLATMTAPESRFTQDSQWLVYAGTGGNDPTCFRPVTKLPLGGGEPQRVTCIDGLQLEVSPDGLWLVHLIAPIGGGQSWQVARTAIAGGAPETIAEGAVLGTKELDFDIADDGSSIAFIQYDGGASALATVPLSGGTITTLVPSGVIGITDYDQDVITYVRWDAATSTEHLGSVLPAGGEPRDLGESTSTLLDEQGGLLLLLDDTSMLYLIPRMGTIWQTVATGASAGHFLPDGRVIFASLDTIQIYDPTDMSIADVRTAVSGPYVLDAERSLFVTSELGDPSEILVGGEIPAKSP
jgi:hypothetical protein